MLSIGSFALLPGLFADVMVVDPASSVSNISLLSGHLVSAIVYSLIGLAILGMSIWLMHRLCPFSIVKEIEHDQNIALGIVMSAVILGISMVIAAAVRG